MTKVLFVRATPKSTEDSTSLQIAERFLSAYKTANPADEITELDLYEDHIPLIDEDVMTGWGKLAKQEDLNRHEGRKVARLAELTDQFLAHDKIVFASPMWNFGFPPMMKAYIDSIAVAGKTFKYTDAGPVGLAADKAVVLLESRGGLYSEGPSADLQFTERYLRTVLQGLLGVKTFEHVVAEGLASTPDRAPEIVEHAARRAETIARTF